MLKFSNKYTALSQNVCLKQFLKQSFQKNFLNFFQPKNHSIHLSITIATKSFLKPTS